MSSSPSSRALPEFAGATGAELVRAAQRGAPGACDALFSRYQRGVTSYCLVASRGDRARALDLTQEIFVRAFCAIGKLSDPERFEGWLFAIAANCCRSCAVQDARRQRILDATILASDAEFDSQEDAAAKERQLELIQRLVDEIDDPTLKAIVRLKYTEPEHTTRAIASALGLAHGTVTSKLQRFRAAAKRELLRAHLALEEASP